MTDYRRNFIATGSFLFERLQQDDGFRKGSTHPTRYMPDVSDIPRESWHFLQNLDLWIIDGLRYTGHPSHFSVSDALSWIDRFKPRRAVVTNMHSDLDYEVLRQSLPPDMIPAYHGMRLTVEQAG
jgi:phosphoribosyl 1,2-cyclic phosphate phosphodiesterase